MLDTVALRTYLREPDADTAALDQLVDLVNGMIDEYGPYPETADSEPAKVRSLRLTVGARAWRNPEGATSRTESIDDHSETVRFDRTNPQSGVYLTASEEFMLRSIAAQLDVVDAPAWSGSLAYRR